MKLLAAILGFLFVAAFLAERWATQDYLRRRRRDYGPPVTRPWWKDPPDPGPEGDH
jgi:hypothetical protein